MTYKELLGPFFDNVLVWVDQSDWQGDTLVLAEVGDRYVFLTFGWGSCSGCDALEACEGDGKALDKLRLEILQSGQSWSTIEAAKRWLLQRDWAVTFLDAELVSDFLEKVKEL